MAGKTIKATVPFMSHKVQYAYTLNSEDLGMTIVSSLPRSVFEICVGNQTIRAILGDFAKNGQSLLKDDMGIQKYNQWVSTNLENLADTLPQRIQAFTQAPTITSKLVISENGKVSIYLNGTKVEEYNMEKSEAQETLVTYRNALLPNDKYFIPV